MLQKNRQSDSDTEEEVQVELPLSIKKKLPELRSHGDIFFKEISGRFYVYRALKRGEFNKFVMNMKSCPEYAEDSVVQSCVLYPDNFCTDDMTQSDFRTILNCIIETSGFGSQEQFISTLQTFRQNAESVIENHIDAIICSAFPTFTPFSLDDLDFSSIMRLLALAEKITQTELPIDKMIQGDVAQRKKALMGGYKGPKLSDFSDDIPVNFNEENAALRDFSGAHDAGTVR